MLERRSCRRQRSSSTSTSSCPTPWGGGLPLVGGRAVARDARVRGVGARAVARRARRPAGRRGRAPAVVRDAGRRRRRLPARRRGAGAPRRPRARRRRRAGAARRRLPGGGVAGWRSGRRSAVPSAPDPGAAGPAGQRHLVGPAPRRLRRARAGRSPTSRSSPPTSARGRAAGPGTRSWGRTPSADAVSAASPSLHGTRPRATIEDVNERSERAIPHSAPCASCAHGAKRVRA